MKTIKELALDRDIARDAAKKFTSASAAAIVKMKIAQGEGGDSEEHQARAKLCKEQARHYADVAVKLDGQIDDTIRAEERENFIQFRMRTFKVSRAEAEYVGE